MKPADPRFLRRRRRTQHGAEERVSIEQCAVGDRLTGAEQTGATGRRIDPRARGQGGLGRGELNSGRGPHRRCVHQRTGGMGRWTAVRGSYVAERICCGSCSSCSELVTLGRSLVVSHGSRWDSSSWPRYDDFAN